MPNAVQTTHTHTHTHTTKTQTKITVLIERLDVRIWNRISQLSELTASAADHNINIVYIQGHRYHQSEVEIKYYDTGNRWTFISISALKNCVKTVIGAMGMLLSPRSLKSLKSIEEIQPRMMVLTFNGNPSRTIISCYSPTNVSNEMDLITGSFSNIFPNTMFNSSMETWMLK